MTDAQESPKLHHVVFAFAPERLAAVAQMYTELGFALQSLELTDLGLVGHLDWERGVEIISVVAGSSSEVAHGILCMEGDAYRRVRGLVAKAFTPRATVRMHDTIAVVADELLDRVIDAGSREFVEDVARPYPIPIICALLGAPREDWEQFSKWAEDVFKIVSFDVDLAKEEPTLLRAWSDFDDYVDDMIAQRRTRLTDDLLSDPIRFEEDGDRLDAGELRMLAFSILVPGTDTTRAQLAASMQVLTDNFEPGNVLRKQPDLAMRTVEESMRHSPAVCSTLRTVNDDITSGKYTFPAQTLILVNTYAANCNPAVYQNPESFDITRDAPPGDDPVTDQQMGEYVAELTGVTASFIETPINFDSFWSGKTRREQRIGRCSTHWKDGVRDTLERLDIIQPG